MENTILALKVISMIIIMIWFLGTLVMIHQKYNVIRIVTEKRYKRWMCYMVAKIIREHGEIGDVAIGYLIYDSADETFRAYMGRTSDEEVLMYIRNIRKDIERLRKKYPDLDALLSGTDLSELKNLNDGE